MRPAGLRWRGSCPVSRPGRRRRPGPRSRARVVGAGQERADPPARAPGTVAVLGPLGVQGDEPGGPGGAGPPRPRRCRRGLPSACPGRRRPAGPRRHGAGLRASSAWHRYVPCRPSSVRWGRRRAAMVSRTASRARRGPRTFSRAGRGPGAHGPRIRLAVWPVLARQDGTGPGRHRQGRRLLIGRGDIAQGVGHRSGGLGDHGRVTPVSLGSPGRQVGDAPHRHPPAGSPPRCPCLWRPPRPRAPIVAGRPTGHQQVPLAAEALIEAAQAGLVARQGPVTESSARPGPGRWPSARP